MKKHKLLFLGAALAAMPFVASAQTDTPFDPSRYDGKTYTDSRHLISFTLQNVDGNSLPEVKYNVNQNENSPRKVYKDLTGATNVFVTTAGATVNFKEVEFSTGYNWIHGFLFIDWDGDKENFGFNSYLNENSFPENTPDIFETLRAPEGKHGELMSFSKHNFGPDESDANKNWYDGFGQKCDDGSGTPTAAAMPQFVIPADIQPGRYPALFKIDYSDISQHADQPLPNNTIQGAKGCAVLFYINIVSDRTITIETEDDELGTVKFQDESITDNPHTFAAGETAVVVATPNEGNTFLNWTKDDEVVSTNAEYTVDITDKEFTLVAHFADPYSIPFDPSRYDGKTYTDSRHLKSFTLQNVDENGNTFAEVKYNVNQDEYSPRKVYKDLTDAEEIFATSPGATVNFKEVEFSAGYNWIHGFLFIDLNQDGGFNSLLNSDNFPENAPAEFDELRVPEEREGKLYGDLMSFSKHNFGPDEGSNKNWYDGFGQKCDDGSGTPTPDAMPSFVIPDNLKPGTYQALFKIDYSDISQHADQPLPNNTIEGAKGCAVLFNIKVEKDTSGIVDIEEAATVAPRYYNLQGIEVAQPTSAGIYIVRQGNTVNKVYVK